MSAACMQTSCAPQATNAVVDAVNRIPLVSTFLEVVGLVRAGSHFFPRTGALHATWCIFVAARHGLSCVLLGVFFVAGTE